MVTLSDAQDSFVSLALAATLVVLGLAAELFSFNQSKESAGSAAVIPLAAAALVAPSAPTVLMILAAEVIVQVMHKRPLIKAVFNLAQHTLGLSLGIAVLHWSGGVSFFEMKGVSFADSLRQQLLPTILLLGVVQFVNNMCVSGAIAVSTGKSFVPMWASNLRQSAPSVLV